MCVWLLLCVQVAMHLNMRGLSDITQTSFCLEETEVLWLQLNQFSTVPLMAHNKMRLVIVEM